MVNVICNDKALEITYTSKDQLIAHTSCIVHRNTQQLEIIDLFAVRQYGDMYFEDMLMEEVLIYAQDQGLTSIIAYVGPEPFNPDPYWTTDDYIDWYASYGFSQKAGTFCRQCMEYQVSLF